jgi:hypothetical protein
VVRGERRALRDAVRGGTGRGRGNPMSTVIGAFYTARRPMNGGLVMSIWGHHHASRVGEGPGAAVGDGGQAARARGQRVRAGGRSCRCIARARARSDRGERR